MQKFDGIYCGVDNTYNFNGCERRTCLTISRPYRHFIEPYRETTNEQVENTSAELVNYSKPIKKAEHEEVSQSEDQVLVQVDHEDKKEDTTEVKQVYFLMSDGVFEFKIGSKFFTMSMIFLKILIMELECGMFKVC